MSCAKEEVQFRVETLNESPRRWCGFVFDYGRHGDRKSWSAEFQRFLRGLTAKGLVIDQVTHIEGRKFYVKATMPSWLRIKERRTDNG